MLLLIVSWCSTTVSYPLQIKNTNTPGAEQAVNLVKTNAILQTHRLSSQRVWVQFFQSWVFRSLQLFTEHFVFTQLSFLVFFLFFKTVFSWPITCYFAFKTGHHFWWDCSESGAQWVKQDRWEMVFSLLIPAFAFTPKYLVHMQAGAFARRTMRTWQQAEKPLFGCFREAVKKEESGRSMLRPESFEELFQGHVPQLSFHPVLSAVTARSTQGHGQYRHMLLPLLPRLIWIRFHSLLFWKYQRLSFKRKPKDYTYMLTWKEFKKHFKDGTITPPEWLAGRNNSKRVLIHCQQPSLMQHSKEFSNSLCSRLTGRSDPPVSSGLSVVWLAMVWEGSQQHLHSRPQLRVSFTVHCIAMKINFPSWFYSREMKKKIKRVKQRGKETLNRKENPQGT